MLEFKIGNILNAVENIICQQVNCKGVMGSGLAKQIRTKWPDIFERYKWFLNEYRESILGRSDIVLVDKGQKFVANLYSQYDYGTGEIYTDYMCFLHAFEAVLISAREFNLSVAVPYKIGCGLAGGDWAVVMNIISEMCMKYKDVKVSIYIFNG